MSRWAQLEAMRMGAGFPHGGWAAFSGLVGGGSVIPGLRMSRDGGLFWGLAGLRGCRDGGILARCVVVSPGQPDGPHVVSGLVSRAWKKSWRPPALRASGCLCGSVRRPAAGGGARIENYWSFIDGRGSWWSVRVGIGKLDRRQDHVMGKEMSMSRNPRTGAT